MKTTLPTGHELDTRACRTCAARTIKEAEWRPFNAAERKQLRAAGFNYRARTDMCERCSQNLRRSGGPDAFPDHEIALRGGRWVQCGLIKKWVSYADQPRQRDIPTRIRKPLSARKARLSALFFCECGCLLAAQNENCPACFAWAVRDSIQHSWRRSA